MDWYRACKKEEGGRDLQGDLDSHRTLCDVESLGSAQWLGADCFPLRSYLQKASGSEGCKLEVADRTPDWRLGISGEVVEVP